MELLGVISALEALNRPCEVEVHSDSQYVCNAFNQHWVEGWIRRGWKTSQKKPVKNVDLWKRLLAAKEPHDVTFHWVKGHAGHEFNERCDQLATAAADGEAARATPGSSRASPTDRPAHHLTRRTSPTNRGQIERQRYDSHRDHRNERHHRVHARRPGERGGRRLCRHPLARSRESRGLHIRAWGDDPFTSLDELAASDGVDAVYIGSPNALHHDQALACIAGGKHVLVEKPFCANRREAVEVFEAARETGVVALEAMRPLHDPAFHAIKEALPQIGAIRRATLRFGKYSSRHDEILAGRHTNIFDCAMASGSLMDIGVYCVEPLIELFGAPERVLASAALLDEATRDLTNGPIDGSGVVLASYPGMTAVLAHSKTTNDLSDSQIEGELGTLTVHGISAPSAIRVELRSHAARQADSVGYSSAQTVGRDIDLPRFENTMQHELADFVQSVEEIRIGGDCTQVPCGTFGNVAHFRDVTLASLDIMDEARRQTGVSFPADRETTAAYES